MNTALRVLYPRFQKRTGSRWSHTSVIYPLRSCLTFWVVYSAEDFTSARKRPWCVASHWVFQLHFTFWWKSVARGCRGRTGNVAEKKNMVVSQFLSGMFVSLFSLPWGSTQAAVLILHKHKTSNDEGTIQLFETLRLDPKGSRVRESSLISIVSFAQKNAAFSWS